MRPDIRWWRCARVLEAPGRRSTPDGSRLDRRRAGVGRRWTSPTVSWSLSFVRCWQTARPAVRAIARSGPGCAASTRWRCRASGSCASCVERVGSPLTGSGAGASSALMWGRSSPTVLTSAWEWTPPWPGPGRWLGVGVRLHRSLQLRSMESRGQDRRPLRSPPAHLRRGHRPLRAPHRRCRPRHLGPPRLGQPIPLPTLHGLDPMAGHDRRPRLPRRARRQRMRRTMDQAP